MVLDGAPPVVTFINPPSKTNNSPQLTWRSTEQATFQCSLDGGPYFNCGSGVSGQWNQRNVREGTRTLSVRGTDLAGNPGRLTSHTWIVGTCKILSHPLLLSLSSFLDYLLWSVSAFICTLSYLLIIPFLSDGVGPVLAFISPSATTSSSPVFTWRSSEQADFECSFDGGEFENCDSGMTGRWSKNNVRDGSHVLSIRGRDSVGNVGRTITHDWIVGKNFHCHTHTKAFLTDFAQYFLCEVFTRILHLTSHDICHVSITFLKVYILTHLSTCTSL